MLTFFLDFLFPRRSLTGVEGGWITEEEQKAMRPHPVVMGTEELLEHGCTALDCVMAACEYRESPLVRKALHTLKYKRATELVPALADLVKQADLPIETDDHPALCPIPLHWTRRFARGFNQAELLAQEIGTRLGLPVTSLLRRSHATGSQVGRKREERRGAMRGAFSVRWNVTVPSHVILVDDVCTTGATLDACAQVLKAAGAKRVEGLVVAKD